MLAMSKAVVVGGLGVVLAGVGFLQAERLPAQTLQKASARTIGAQLTSVQAQSARRIAVAPAPAGGLDHALIDHYCVTCHSLRRKTAGLVLEGIDTEHIGANAEVWEKVAQKLRSGEMPPAGMPRPDAATYRAYATSIETALDRAAAAHVNAGRVSFQRLNRNEYVNAIRDVLALDVDAAELLPPDETGYGFDNIASVLSFSPGLLERYSLAAWKISRLAVGDRTMKPQIAEYKVSPHLVQDDNMGDDFPLGSRGGIAIRHYFPLDGEYTARIGLTRSPATNTIRGINRAEQLDLRMNGERVKVFKIGGECNGSKEARCQAFRPKFDDAQFGIRELPAEYDMTADSALEVRFPAKAGPALITVTFVPTSTAVAEGAAPARMPAAGSAEGGSSEMGVEKLRIQGPFDPTGPGNTPSRKRIFACHPTSSGEELPCAKAILRTVARRAYRRPTTDKDIQELLVFFDKGRKQGDFEVGIQYALEAMLMSPNFLVRTVADPAKAAPNTAYRLSNLELASRLSFFLWSSIPDDELLDVAVKGTLTDPKVLEQQVRRMLADPKSTAFVSNFFGQWLSLRDLKNVSPDPITFPDFDDTLRENFQRETQMFLESQVREDHGVIDLLTANYTFLNERLAHFYGIPGVYGSHFRRVALTDPNRAGLLGQGSILTVTSYSTRTSPVVRGKWILTNVLGAPPPPPPPNVPALKENGEGGEAPSTVRARMEAHRSNPVCASCHVRMDPMGFALENYSAIGKWRTTEAGAPIDSTGQFPDGAKFGAPSEFRKLLLNYREDFVGTLTTKLMTYALGRGVEYYDMPAVRTVIRNAAGSDYRWTALILGTVESVPFQMNQIEAPEPPQANQTEALEAAPSGQIVSVK